MAKKLNIVMDMTLTIVVVGVLMFYTAHRGVYDGLWWPVSPISGDLTSQQIDRQSGSGFIPDFIKNSFSFSLMFVS